MCVCVLGVEGVCVYKIYTFIYTHFCMHHTSTHTYTHAYASAHTHNYKYMDQDFNGCFFGNIKYIKN